MKKPDWKFYTGIGILILLAITYLIRIPKDSGTNFVTYTKLLSILIFYNPYILAIYIIIALILIFLGLSKKKIRIIS